MNSLLRIWTVCWLVGLSACSGQMKSEEYEVGFQGLAARNPYLGAQRLAEYLGYEGRGTTTLSAMPPTDWTLLLRPGVMTGAEDQADELLAWVEEGGDLWVDLEDYILEEDEVPGEVEDGPAQWALYQLMGELELDWQYNGGEEHEGLDCVPELRLDWPECDLVLSDEQERAWSVWGHNSSAAMLHLPWGQGSVHFFASLSLFDNDHLRDADHAEVLEYFLANAKPGQPTRGLMVVYGGGRSFLALLWQHAWFFLIAFGLLTLVWLWRVSRRFGPALEDPEWDPEGVGIGGGREFTEHIDAAGRTYERRGQSAKLEDAAEARALRVQTNLPHEDAEQLRYLRSSHAPFLKKIKALQAAALRADDGPRVTIRPLETHND